MSKAAKQIILILIILVVAALGFAGFIASQKQSIEDAKVALEAELDRSQQREGDYIEDAKKLKAEIKEIAQAKAALEEELSKFADVDLEEIDLERHS